MSEPTFVKNTRDHDVFIAVLVCDLSLALLKLTLGVMGYTKLILADGIFSAANAAVLILSWQGHVLESRPADEKHPYGYGKSLFLVEAVAGAVFMIASIYMFFYGVYGMEWVEAHRSHSGAFMAALISLVANEVLFRYLQDTGKQNNNATFLWNATHHRMNAIVSAWILVCITLSSLGLAYMDRIGVSLAAMLMFVVSLRVLIHSFSGIMDRMPPRQLLNEIQSFVKRTKGVEAVVDIKARFVGSKLHVDLNVLVDSGLKMREADAIARDVEARVLKQFERVREVNVMLV
ncbi:MAG: cation diffusion facilitator family transporter [Candidatus Omnitrophica bacterium]|nr:cation diffusion facilitator family transporter [Candidatus Omnitrophota bacterium]